MPDESCRLCGGDLAIHSQCGECRKAMQRICKSCDTLTRKQFHDHGSNQESILKVQNGYALETIREEPSSRNSYSIRSFVISFGIIGFFILGFATNVYLDAFQTLPSSVEMTNPDAISVPQTGYTSVIHNSLQNCLAYGSGESITVTCPTQYGYVYKAILNMPKDLAAMFSDSVFSLRGVSVTESSDGTVMLQYRNNHYLTNFFAS
jgi:hypothetical protein